MEVLVHGAVIVFGLTLVYAGTIYLDRTMGQLSAAIQYPIEALNASALVGGVLIIVHAAARIARETAVPRRSSRHERSRRRPPVGVTVLLSARGSRRLHAWARRARRPSGRRYQM